MAATPAAETKPSPAPGDGLRFLAMAIVVGALAGLIVSAIESATDLLHTVLFGLAPGTRLSSSEVPGWRVLLVPVLGGLAYGLVSRELDRRRKEPVVDPIEANAVAGGRMALGDSAVIGAQTVVSSGVGASVGLEGGYTQVCAAAGSWLGSRLGLQRSELRLLVACGGGAGIATAFNAPLTGAFYAFELLLGSYAIPSFAPVLAACLAGVLVGRQLLDAGYVIGISGSPQLAVADLPLLAGLGLLCAAAGILLMRLVGWTERAFRASPLPTALRPCLAGAIVGGLALLVPQVLSSGHGALVVGLQSVAHLHLLVLVVALKAVASAVSLGSGFRGGLFFASLLLGSVIGEAMSLALAPYLAIDPVGFGIVGMSAMAVAVIGGPFTMVTLALETSGAFALLMPVTVGVLVASFATRHLFGYSFATWRFHLRGAAILGPEDLDPLHELTVGTAMTPGLASSIPADAPTVTRGMPLRQALALLETTTAAELPVIDDYTGARVGALTRMAAMRTYLDALDRGGPDRP
ncbi:MAG: chloride channel protein [Geminicoccaceae bacterium]